MTDITDQDRRQLREDAKAVINKTAMRGSAAVSIARYILATVDAPAPTLAEEMRGLASEYEEDGEPDPSVDLYRLADRVEQIEQEREEARAEVTALAEDLAGAESEVERLTAVNKELRRTDNYKEFREQFLTVQKGAESNAENLDPADVKPGEAWIVEVRSERRTAVQDGCSSLSWNTVNPGGYFLAEDSRDVTLVARLVPAPRVITNAEDLDALADGSIIRARDGDACRKTDAGDWSVDGLDGAVGYGPRQVLPATVLWEPEA